MRKTVIAALAIAVSAGMGDAAGQGKVPDASTLNPAAIKFVLPEKIDWRPAAGLAGTDGAVLFGDPSKPGFYIQLNRFHPGNFSRPHYHANDRYIMVVSGTWWVGTGARFDPENATVPMKAGTFVTHTGREVHYDGARSGSDEAVVMIFGQGPGTRTECEGPAAENGPGPCETARKAVAAPASAQTSEVKVFVGGAMTQPVKEVGAAFARSSGSALAYVSDTTGGLQRRLAAGEPADLVIVTGPAMDTLQKEGRVVAGSRIDLARALIGVGVRAGAPAVDLSTPDAFKAALLKARSVSYVNPSSGGASGTYFEGLLQRMGIADAMKAKIVYRTQGSEVAAAVAGGEAELGITFISELQPNKGVKVAGAFPAAIQMPTIYAAAVTTSAAGADRARAFLRTLAGAEGREALTKAGLEPLNPGR